VNKALEENGFCPVNGSDVKTLDTKNFKAIAKKWNWEESIPFIFGWRPNISPLDRFDKHQFPASLRPSLQMALRECRDDFVHPWNKEFENLILLDHHRYWGRGWVIPEIVSADHHVLMCGGHVLKADDLWATILFLQAISPHASMVNDKYNKCRLRGFWNINVVIRLKCNSVASKFSAGSWATHTLNLLTTNVTNPRDKVYSLIGLAGTGVSVDYDCSVQQVYTSYCKIFLPIGDVKTGNFAFFFLILSGLMYREKDVLNLSFPSWVPNLNSFSREEDHSPFCRGGCSGNTDKKAELLTSCATAEAGTHWESKW